MDENRVCDDIVEVVKFFMNQGFRCSKDEFLKMYDYVLAMAQDDRIFMISDLDGNPITFVAVSICDDFSPYYDKLTWDYLPHDPEGHIAYIEKLVSKRWNSDQRWILKRSILVKYPNVDRGVWYRPTKGVDIKHVHIVNRKKIFGGSLCIR